MAKNTQAKEKMKLDIIILDILIFFKLKKKTEIKHFLKIKLAKKNVMLYCMLYNFKKSTLITTQNTVFYQCNLNEYGVFNNGIVYKILLGISRQVII